MKKREIKRKLHNGILWLVTYSAFILFNLSASCIAPESVIHVVIMIGSLAWLLLFALVNKDRW